MDDWKIMFALKRVIKVNRPLIISNNMDRVSRSTSSTLLPYFIFISYVLEREDVTNEDAIELTIREHCIYELVLHASNIYYYNHSWHWQSDIDAMKAAEEAQQVVAQAQQEGILDNLAAMPAEFEIPHFMQSSTFAYEESSRTHEDSYNSKLSLMLWTTTL
ncbi:hypothetical protein RIF29_09005 [Crotalaria pallida]|uniref:Uncharacterized protein n=1 Tax=Crotalaria pallida TaxID=3830 RepID=A0AAN9FU36_CROPI